MHEEEDAIFDDVYRKPFNNIRHHARIGGKHFVKYNSNLNKMRKTSPFELWNKRIVHERYLHQIPSNKVPRSDSFVQDLKNAYIHYNKL